MIFTDPNTGWHSIENDEVAQALKYLFNETSCTMVTKEGKTVAFTLWSKNMDISGGVVCSESSVDIEFLTKLQPLSMPTWYYYVSDFNVYRISKT